MLFALVAATYPSTPAAAEGNFALQVSPSPLVTTIKPGEATSLELKIRNASTEPERLKMEARSFRFDNETGKVSIDDTLAPAIAQWITLPEPGFEVKPGQWRTQKIAIDLPKDVGFSYSFVLVISRANSSSTNNGQLLKGSVAVFTLINIDRPDATRRLELSSVETDQSVYEFLPSKITVKLRNTGNSIVQPYGNLFIQRPGDTAHPLATLPVNETQAYILPNTERTLEATWANGFPRYRSSTDSAGTQQTSLEWNIEQIRHFRFGQYTAKVVAVYNDGTRDVPIVGEVTFWVIPWKTMLAITIVLVGFALLYRRYLKFRTDRAVKKALKKQADEQS